MDYVPEVHGQQGIGSWEGRESWKNRPCPGNHGLSGPDAWERDLYGMAIQELIQTMDMENVAPLAGSTIRDGSTGAEPAKHLGKKKWKNIMQHIISWSQSRVVADCTQTTYQVGCTCK